MTSTALSYQAYIHDEAFLERYRTYNKRYAKQARQSDKVLIEIIRKLVAPALRRGQRPAVLDCGCSTGNFLLHLNQAVPGLELVGGDIATQAIREAQHNPALHGIQFEEMDVLTLQAPRRFDVVVLNAVCFSFPDDAFSCAIHNVASALKPGGWLAAFDWFHPFEQELTVIERSRDYPHGVSFYLRGYATVQAVLTAAGFDQASFSPFHPPIDLARSADAGDLTTSTIRSDRGERLSFRGALCQPWCHLVAQRRSTTTD